MKTRLANNIFSAAGQNIVQTLVLLILYRYLIDQIGVNQIGIWSVVMAVASFIQISELGFSSSIINFVAAYRATEEHQLASETIQTAAITVAVLFAISVMLSYPLLKLALPYMLPVKGLKTGRIILPYGLASFWLISISNIWMNALDACFSSGKRSTIMILGSIAFFPLAIIGVKYLGLIGLVVAQLFQGIFLVIVGWFAIRKVMYINPILPQQWRFTRFREMFCYGINFQINSIVMLLFEPATKIMFARHGGLSSAGYFEMAQRMVGKVRALIVESNRVIVSEYASMNNYEIDAPKLYTRNMNNLILIVIPLFSALMALIPAICEVWIGKFISRFVIIGIFITLAWFINTITSPAYFAYLGQGKLRWVTIAHIFMGTINILAGSVLGYTYGWQGVLASFVIALMIGSLIPIWAYHYEHRINSSHIFSSSDVKSAIICFGSSLSILFCYFEFLNHSTLLCWERISIFTFTIGMMSFASFWFHPFRKKLLAFAIYIIKFSGIKV